VTAAFNLNILRRINAELRGDFVLEQFVHRALWNAQAARIEMHLESLCDQAVHVGGRTFHLRAGETIHTENSHKFTVEGFASMANRAGWSLVEHWVAEAYTFAAVLLQRDPQP
jgi:uncharacterized SAM-dependent methyltransferase